MKRYATSLLALLLVLGFLVGDFRADQEPGDRPGPAGVVEPSMVDDRTSDVAGTAGIPYADGGVPVRLRIPSLGIHGDVRPVGMSDATTMQVPEDISVVGWFDRSALPIAEAGNTVLVGHRDGETDPNGVFRRLGDIGQGDAITVRDHSGRRIDYEVTHVDVLHDEVFARVAPDIFRTSGPHRLVLVTCGGTYDKDKGGYQANVVVMAKRT